MADREAIPDTTLMALQGVDLYNATIMQSLIEALVKTGTVDCELLVDVIREKVGLINANSREPAAAANYRRMTDKLVEDIEIWQQQG